VQQLRFIIVLALIAPGLAAAGLRPSSQPAPVVGVTASAPLGSVATATVTLDNLGQPAAEVLLYEAFDPAPAALASLPPAPLRVPLPDLPGPLAPGLLDQLNAAPGGRGRMLIFLGEQADLSAAASLGDWNARGAAVVAVLQQQAARSQAPLLAALRSRGDQPRSFWIVNAIAVDGDATLAQWLAAQPGVALVAPNFVHILDDAPEPVAVSGAGQAAWGVERIGAPSVWADWGVRGAGIVVASLDTGAHVSHTALLTAYRGWSSGGLNHDYNWYDAAGEPPSPVPLDGAGHGTHTLGTLVGGSAGGFAGLGVAPGARWIAVRACPGFFCSDEALIAGAQWLLAPTAVDGSSPRPDLRPHMINNSWGKLGDDPWYLGYVTAWNAAGIFSVFAIGNAGMLWSCGSSNTPGSYAESLSVGATDGDDLIADFSSRGPTADGRIKPDLSAPGVAIPSAWPDGGLRSQSGTSMAAPHVAGVAALLWSANPTLWGNLEATHLALTSSAVQLPSAECGGGAPGVPNNVYGWGRLDARAAVAAVRVDVPWLAIPASAVLPANGTLPVELTLDARQVSAPGDYTARLLASRLGSLTAIPITFTVLPNPDTAPLTGALTDAWHGQPVYGRVFVGHGPAVQTDHGGHYSATLPFGSYALTATASGHFSATAAISFTGPTTASLALVPDLPRLLVTSPVLSATLAFAEQRHFPITITNAGTQPLSLTVAIPPTEWIVETAGQSGASLYDLSAVAPLSLTDDLIYPDPLPLGFYVPINGVLTSELYLSSNGWVSAVRAGSAAPFANCLPSSSLPPFSLAPFWADLDPSQGGAVRAGHVTSDTFVISFEAVPPWEQSPSPDPPTYTFQVALHASGQVEFLYGDMGILPARWGAGAGHSQQRGQSLACFKSPLELSGRWWQMHNQPLPSVWLAAAPAEAWIAPGASTLLTASLHGYGYVPWHPGPFAGPLVLNSNDPSQRSLVITATATVAAAPFAFYAPIIHR
jgi:subtilisin family serine protease